MPRRNMDESLRRLERAALRGDPRAGQALVVAWCRAGLPPELAMLVRRVWSMPGKLPEPDAAVALASRILQRPLASLEELAVRGSLWNEALAERAYQQENPLRRNADEDLRVLERRANATRSPGDIQRYEAAASRVGFRRLVSVDELVPTVKWPRAVAGMRWHRGLALGKPVQIETVGEVLELIPAAADQGGQRGLKRFWCPSRAPWFGAPVGNDPTSAYAGAWGRAVDPLESYLHRDTDGSERSWLAVPVAVPGLSGVRLMATHVWLWDRLPPWANDVPRIVRTLRPTGEMTGFLSDDPVVPPHGRPRRNTDERLRRLERAAATGDDDARRLLEIERQRAGILTPEARRLTVGPKRGRVWRLDMADAIRNYAEEQVEEMVHEYGLPAADLGDGDEPLAFVLHILDHDWRIDDETQVLQALGVGEETDRPPPTKTELVELIEKVMPCRTRRRLLKGAWERLDEDGRDAMTTHFGEWIEHDLSGRLPCVTHVAPRPRKKNTPAMLSDYGASFDDFVTVVQQLLGDRLGFDAKARARIQHTPLPIRLRPVSDFLPQAQREASGGWKDDRGDDYFEDMKRAIADGVRLPPVVSRGGFLVDGFHRVLAYADLGLTEIEAFDLGEWAEFAMA